jgi:hypothetical protein
MDKLIELHEKVSLCYSKIPWKAYQSLSQDEKERICKKEREEFVTYVDSDSLNHDNILKEKMTQLDGKYIKFYM